jgi:hypothetical protein
MLRLTALQYANTVRDVFDGKLAASAEFPTHTTEISESGFSTDPDTTTVTQLDARQILLAAEDTAVEIAERLPEFLACYPSSADEACASDFVARYARRALRREPTPAETEALLGAFRDAAPDGFDVGVAAIVSTLLQMPAFLYRVEVGAVDSPAAGATVPLTGPEIATRLSYLLWETPPDEDLGGAADRGELSTPAGIRAAAERLLDDPRSRGAVTRFYREWSALRVFEGGQKDARLYPGFDQAVATSMQESFDRFVYEATVSAGSTLTDLLTSTDLHVDRALAGFLGLPAPEGPAEFARVTLPERQAAGLLTQPALLSGLAHEAVTSPVFRGKFVRTKLLCGVLESPPADALARQPEYPPNANEREKAEALLQVDECAACHVQMNPIGVAFEEYDAAGRFRTAYPDGRAVDGHGEVLGGGDAAGEFDGVRELGTRLAGSERVRECIAEQWLRFTFSRKETAGDACALDRMGRTFAASGYSMRELVLSLVSEPEFSNRTLVNGETP